MNDNKELGQVAYEGYIDVLRELSPQNLMHLVKWSDLPDNNKKMWAAAEEASGRRMVDYMDGHDMSIDSRGLGYDPCTV